MHAIAVVFNFVERLVALRRGVDQLSQLQADPLRQRGRGDAPARYRSRPWRNWKEFMMPAHRPRNYPSTTAKRAPMVRAAN